MIPILFAFLSACAFALPFELLETAEIAARMPAGTFAEKLSAFLPVLGTRMFPQGMLLFLLFLLLYRVLIKRIRRKQFSMASPISLSENARLFTLTWARFSATCPSG